MSDNANLLDMEPSDALGRKQHYIVVKSAALE